MARKRKELTEILLEMGVIKAPAAAAAVDEAKTTLMPVDQVLLLWRQRLRRVGVVWRTF